MASLWTIVASLGVSAVQVGAASSGVGSVLVQADQMLELFKKQGLKETPGVRARVQEITNDLANVVPLINAGHHSTQRAIDDHLNDWMSQSDTTDSLLTAARLKDSMWYSCVEKEKEVLVELEEARASLPVCVTRRDGLCLEANNTRSSRRSLPVGLARFSCNMETNAEACRNAFNARRATFTADMATLLSAVQGDVQVWNLAHDACGSVTQDCLNIEADIASLEGAHSERRSTCESEYEKRVGGFCTFSDAYGKHCDAKASYNQLVADTQMASGSDANPHSVSDRQKEFTQVGATKCQLQAFLDDNANPDCAEDKFQFPLQLTFPKSLPSVFDCSETAFTFSGRTWSLPQSRTDPVSSDYVSTSFSIDVVDEAFSFCPLGGDLPRL